MRIDAEDFRRQYANLNDDALLAIDRDELTPVAQQVYDAELASRGIEVIVEEEVLVEGEPDDPLANMVEIAAFDNPSEASMARSMLEHTEIPCMLSTDLPLVGSMLNVASEIKLFVPAELADEALDVLEAEFSEEELAAQAEAAAVIEEEIVEEEIIEEEIRSEE
jgi:hypothetical protein